MFLNPCFSLILSLQALASAESNVDFSDLSVVQALQHEIEEQKDILALKDAEALHLREQIQALKVSLDLSKKEHTGLRLRTPLPDSVKLATPLSSPEPRDRARTSSPKWPDGF